MGIIVISNKDNLDWVPLSAKAKKIGAVVSDIISVNSNCVCSYEKNIVATQNYFIIINELVSICDILKVADLANIEFILVHDLDSVNNKQSPKPTSLLYRVLGSLINIHENNQITVQAFSHFQDNKIWQHLHKYIQLVIDDKVKEAKSQYEIFINNLNEQKDVQLQESVKTSIINNLIPLAAYDLLMQSTVEANFNISDDVIKKTNEAAVDALEILREEHKDSIYIKKLEITGKYDPDFHTDLQKLSSTLVKPYG